MYVAGTTYVSEDLIDSVDTLDSVDIEERLDGRNRRPLAAVVVDRDAN